MFTVKKEQIHLHVIMLTVSISKMWTDISGASEYIRFGYSLKYCIRA